jgi:glycerol-3-phosphate dehydrogenase
MKYPEISKYTRDEINSQLPNSKWDVVVIGGGITGAGTALECVNRGWKTLLLDKGDFASGTSSKSSGMVHGGLRYLEQGNFKLVKEALKERYFLNKNIPELVKTNRFLFPIYNSWWMYLKVKLGVFLYDLFAGKFNLQNHERLTKKQILKKYPLINPQHLKGGFLYSDCLVSDSHLVFSVLSTAVQKGLKIANYVEVNPSIKKNSLFEIKWKDQLSGKREFLNSKIVISCTGVWSNYFNNKKNNLIRPTKGVHIVIPYSRLKISTSFVLPSNDGRILFANRMGDFLYIGTTDTDFNTNYDKVYADSKDINYILKKVNEIFPTLNLTSIDIISTWAGLRPLLINEGNPSKISREDLISDTEGYIQICGGKLTTYRCMALKAMEKAEKYLNVSNKPKNNIQLNSIYFINENLEIQVEQYLKTSMPITLIDLMERRLNMYRFDNKNGLDKIDLIADKMASYLNWTSSERGKQICDYKNYINENQGRALAKLD